MIWPQEMQDVAKLAGAYLLAIPVGWNQEKEAHSVGVRTFPLVSLASCGWVVMATSLNHGTIDPQSRVMQGIVAGIGFVGAGAILKSENHVHGTASAASIWNIAAVGAAVAMEHYLVAILLAFLNFVTLRYLLPVKQLIDSGEEGPPTSRVTRARDD
jgi:putative Mg2+ transporter-C (MgtC) family protein